MPTIPAGGAAQPGGGHHLAALLGSPSGVRLCWFVGRPTLEELRQDLRAMMLVYHPD